MEYLFLGLEVVIEAAGQYTRGIPYFTYGSGFKSSAGKEYRGNLKYFLPAVADGSPSLFFFGSLFNR